MPDVLSVEGPARAERAPRAAALDVPARVRLGMVALGFIPALHLIAAVMPLAFAVMGRVRPAAAWLTPAILFLVPPLVVRASTWWSPLPSGRVEPGSGGFLHWWFTAQWQVVFTRLPMLEETIRMIPGLYSLWLRLWGARVGALVYWAPGVVVLDRSLVRIGNRVIFGVGARLNPHVLAPGEPSRTALYLAPIAIGDDALVGGYSILLPGCEVAEGEATPPFRAIHAFSRFANGRRVPGSEATDESRTASAGSRSVDECRPASLARRSRSAGRAAKAAAGPTSEDRWRPASAGLTSEDDVE